MGRVDRRVVYLDSSSTCLVVLPICSAPLLYFNLDPPTKREKGRKRQGEGEHTFRPDTVTVAIDPYFSSLTLLSLIGLFPMYFPSFSFHAFRKSSGSENAMNPYLA